MKNRGCICSIYERTASPLPGLWLWIYHGGGGHAFRSVVGADADRTKTHLTALLNVVIPLMAHASLFYWIAQDVFAPFENDQFEWGQWQYRQTIRIWTDALLLLHQNWLVSFVRLRLPISTAEKSSISTLPAYLICNSHSRRRQDCRLVKLKYTLVRLSTAVPSRTINGNLNICLRQWTYLRSRQRNPICGYYCIGSGEARRADNYHWQGIMYQTKATTQNYLIYRSKVVNTDIRSLKRSSVANLILWL